MPKSHVLVAKGGIVLFALGTLWSHLSTLAASGVGSDGCAVDDLSAWREVTAEPSNIPKAPTQHAILTDPFGDHYVKLDSFKKQS